MDKAEIDSVPPASDEGKRILERARKPMQENYVPPISTVRHLVSNEEAIRILTYEAAADAGDVQLRSRIFYEISCWQKKYRQLSIWVSTEHGDGSIDKPGDWQFLPPEGNAHDLARLVCL